MGGGTGREHNWCRCLCAFVCQLGGGEQAWVIEKVFWFLGGESDGVGGEETESEWTVATGVRKKTGKRKELFLKNR